MRGRDREGVSPSRQRHFETTSMYGQLRERFNQERDLTTSISVNDHGSRPIRRFTAVRNSRNCFETSGPSEPG